DESAFAALRIDEVVADWHARLGGDPPPGHRLLLGAVVTDPVLTIDAAADLLGGDDNARSVVADLLDADVLRPLTARTRNPVWVAHALTAEVDELRARIAAAACSVPDGHLLSGTAA
ncbi:MAG: hypothetical protein INR72_18320, partial [Williamsia herbipolensis]|nr:hypothetical protein [Williamsia herbipolensis]